MREYRAEIKEEISKIFGDFLNEELGKKPASVIPLIQGNIITVYAMDCLTPAERNLLENDRHHKLLQELKTLEFERAKAILKKRMEEILNCRVEKIYSTLGKDGIRFLHITLCEEFINKKQKSPVVKP